MPEDENVSIAANNYNWRAREQEKIARTPFHKQNRQIPTARGQENHGNTTRTTKEPEIA